MQAFMSKFGIPLVVALFVLAAVVLFINLRGGSSVTGNMNLAFFIDEETGTESKLPASELPPLMSKDGKPSVVGVAKFGFQDNKTGKIIEERVVYYYKFTPEAQEALKTMDKHAPERQDVFFTGQLVRSPQPDSKWVPYKSDEGMAVTVLPNPPTGTHIVQLSPK